MHGAWNGSQAGHVFGVVPSGNFVEPPLVRVGFDNVVRIGLFATARARAFERLRQSADDSLFIARDFAPGLLPLRA